MGVRKVAAAVLAVLAISLAPLAGKAAMTDVLTLDIRGEPFGETLDRSTLRIDTAIPLGLLGVPLPEIGEWNGRRYQIRLQGGAGRSAVIPWTPAGGTIWLQGGVVAGIDLSFVNPHKTRAEAPDWQPPLATLTQPPATPDQVADSLIAIHAALQTLDARPVEQVACAENLPVSEPADCPGSTILGGALTPDRIRQAVIDLQAGYAADLARDPALLDAPARRLVLGQWWLPNGDLVMLAATTSLETASDDVPLQDRPVGVTVSLNINEFFNASLAQLMESCFDQQALLPDAMQFTPAQAAQIFRGIHADFYPPTVDGRTVTDRIALQRLDWARLADAYWNDPDTRRGFCAHLVQLLGRL